MNDIYRPSVANVFARRSMHVNQCVLICRLGGMLNPM